MDKPRRGSKIYPVLAVLWIVCILAQREGRRKEIHSYCPDSLLLTVHYCKYYSWVSHSEEIGNLTLLTHFHFTNHFHHDIFFFFFTVTFLQQSFSTSVRVKAAHELCIVQYIQCTDLSPNLEGDVEVHGSTTK